MSGPSAADLIAQAQAATTIEELDAIAQQAAGRVTVIDAVDQRYQELENQTVPEAPIVDPSPHAAPIMAGPEEYVFPPAEASPQEVLDLKPNDYESATEGPHPQISQTMYVHMTKPDGTEFLAPLSNQDYYEAKGYTAGSAEDIPDLVAYQAERAATEPAAPASP